MTRTSRRPLRPWLALLWLLAALPAGGQTITLTGSWTLTLSAADLQPPGPGLNFTTPRDSADNQVLINTTRPGNTLHTVLVYRIDSPGWNAALTLRVIRTGDGTGTGTISGGTDPGVIVPAGQANRVAFFDVRRNRSNIPIKLRLDGLTVALGAPATYTTTVYYEIQ